jgi:DNA replication protein DnaC
MKPTIKQPLKTAWQRKWLALDATCAPLQALADAAEAFCHRWFINDTRNCVLVIVGDSGNGKTHTLRAIHNFCTASAMAAFEKQNWGGEKIPKTFYLSWPEAANEFNEKRFSLMSDALNADLLCLDDIGAENDPWNVCKDRLCQLLSKRERKFTVITTNIAPAKWNEKFEARIDDRLLRNSVVIDLTGVTSYAHLN